MTKDTRIEGTSVILMRRSVKAQTGRRYFYFFLLSFFFLSSLFFLSFRFACVLFFFFFFFDPHRVISSHTFFFSFTRNYAFLSLFLSFFLFFSLSRNESRKSFAFYSLPFQSLCALPPFTARGAIVWSDNGIFYWIPVNTYPPFNRFDCS